MRAELREQGARDGVFGGRAVESEDRDAPGVGGGDGADVDERRGGRGGVGGPLCGEAQTEEDEWGAHCGIAGGAGWGGEEERGSGGPRAGSRVSAGTRYKWARHHPPSLACQESRPIFSSSCLSIYI